VLSSFFLGGLAMQRQLDKIGICDIPCYNHNGIQLFLGLQVDG
jgi:hypothetical protein